MINSSFLNDTNISIIKYPIITDKATRLLANNQYSFVVNPKSDKLAIKAAVEYLFNVKVIKINTAHFWGSNRNSKIQKTLSQKLLLDISAEMSVFVKVEPG